MRTCTPAPAHAAAANHRRTFAQRKDLITQHRIHFIRGCQPPSHCTRGRNNQGKRPPCPRERPLDRRLADRASKSACRGRERGKQGGRTRGKQDRRTTKKQLPCDQNSQVTGCRTLWPVVILPEKTRPNAKKRPLSEDGIILETYIMRGPSGSQFIMALAYTSSGGPSYSVAYRYFCAECGDGR